MRNDFYTGYLQHAASGSSRENHKYIARIGTPNNYIYFYTQAELDRYKKTGALPKNRGASSSSSESKSVDVKSNLSKTGATKSKSGKSKGSSGKKSSKASKGASASKASSKKAAAAKVEKATTSKATEKNKTDEMKKKYEDVINKYKMALTDKKLASAPKTIENLKMNNNVSDNDVSRHSNTKEFMDSLNKSDEGSYGYVQAGKTAYKWAKQNGQVIIRSLDGKQNVNLDPNLINLQSFRIDKNKKKAGGK